MSNLRSWLNRNSFPLGVICFVIAVIGVISYLFPITHERIMTYESPKYPIYDISAPWGYMKHEGEIGGGFLSFRGEIRTEEIYIVKYWVDNEIHTSEDIPAVDQPLTVDGQFFFQMRHWTTIGYNVFGHYTGEVSISFRDWEYEIHLPYAPNATFGEQP